MENLILSLNVVLPLFLTMALGYFLKLIGMFDKKLLDSMNNLVFKAFLPVLLFNNIYKTNLDGALNVKLLSFAFLAVIGTFLVVTFLVPLIEKDNRKRGVMIQGMFRSNFVIFGLTVASAMYDESTVGIIAILVGIIIPTFNVLAVVCLEMFRGGKLNFKQLIKGVITNPLIIASVIGIFFLYFGIKFPTAIENSVNDIAKIATPLSLILLGGSFAFKDVKKYLKPIIITVIGRLVVVPGIVIPISVWAGFRSIDLLGLLLIFASPTAVSSFTMAQKMDGDSDLAAQIVVFTSAFSVLSVFLWIFTLKQLNLM
ncbi:MAG: AEC family transporter [Clostridium sp.]|nr:AEC family transporter [Clostridium sp.]MDU7084131.1 AEC family transporter [Clostridium sp.]